MCTFGPTRRGWARFPHTRRHTRAATRTRVLAIALAFAAVGGPARVTTILDRRGDIDLPCVQAVTSETLTMYRFPEQEQAVAMARGLAGEAYRSGWIVIHVEPGALTLAERRDIALSVDCTNVGVTADGVER